MKTLTLEDRKRLLTYHALNGKSETTRLKSLEMLCKLEGDWIEKKDVDLSGNYVIIEKVDKDI